MTRYDEGTCPVSVSVSPSAPAPSPICCLRVRLKLLYLSDSGLLLFIFIVHYYDVSLLHNNVIYKQSNMILNAFTAAHICISIFPIEHYCKQLPGLGHGSRSSPRCRYFLRQITKLLQPAVDTHPPPAFLETLFRKASDIL